MPEKTDGVDTIAAAAKPQPDEPRETAYSKVICYSGLETERSKFLCCVVLLDSHWSKPSAWVQVVSLSPARSQKRLRLSHHHTDW